MRPYLIIYHGNCCDGFTAAWAAQRLLDGPCELFAATYASDGADVDLPDVTGRRVYMVDFCVGEAQLRRLIDAAESIRVFDHHSENEKACGQFECCTFDMDRSGAGLTWDILSGGAVRPWLIDYVEDRDLWRHALPDTRAINAFIALVPKTIDEWNMLNFLGLDNVAIRGTIAVKAANAYVEAMLPLAQLTTFLGHADIPVINAPPPNISDLVGRLAEGTEFAVGWHQRADGHYVYSLRSRGDFDVGALAQTMGGGGHPGSAGFTVSEPVGSSLFDLLTLGGIDEETARRQLRKMTRHVGTVGIVVTEPERVEILAPTLSTWRVGGTEVTEAEIAVDLAEALEAGPGPMSNLRQIDEGDLRRDRLRAFVGKFSIWEIDGEIVAKLGHDFDHADPGVMLDRRDLIAEMTSALAQAEAETLEHGWTKHVWRKKDGETIWASPHCVDHGQISMFEE